MLSDRMALRRERLRATLAAEGEGAEAVLVVAPVNVTYLTGFTGDSSLLLVTHDREILISDGRYTTQLARECPGLALHIRAVGQTIAAAVAEVVGKLGLRRVAFEAAHLSVEQHLKICELTPKAKWRGAVMWVETLRLVKDAEEIAAMRQAIAMAEHAFERLRAGLKDELDRSEKEVADALEHELRCAGATAAAFPPIVAAGANSALPHARPSTSTRLSSHDFVLFDWGAVAALYHSDLTRIVVTRRRTERFDDVYRSVLEAQRRAIASIRPGVSSRDVDKAARGSLEEAGLAERFTHSSGHGLGMGLHELPALGREPDITLEPGMIVTVEPGVYIPEWGGIRIEDNVLVTPNGAEVLSSVPKDLESVVLR